MIPGLVADNHWLGLAPAQTLQRVARNFDTALKRFCKGISKFPVPKKKKDNNDSFYITNQGALYIKGNKIKLPKLGMMKFRTGKLPEGKILSGVVRQNGNEWELSINCEIEIDIPNIAPTFDKTIGVDMGLKDLIITSEGEVFSNKKHFKQ